MEQTNPQPPQQIPHLRPEEAKQELRQAIQGSQEILATATTVFPFTLFPDTVTLDRTKLTITRRTFFAVAEVMSIRIEDIMNVTSGVGPFFGSIKFTSRVFNNEKPYSVNYFWRSDAQRLKRVMQGYVIAMQRAIDCSSLGAAELAAMLEKLGEDEHGV